MRKRKIWKQLTALMLGAVLAVPAPMASAAEPAAQGQQEAPLQEGNRAADANGFEIVDGVLVKYTGTATEVEKGDGKLTYKSSDTKVVAVDEDGKATIKGMGIAAISVTAAETTKYKKAAASITVEVAPAKPKTLTAKAAGGRKVKVSWKKDVRATGYDIQYSTDKGFKNKKATKTVTVKRGKTTSYTLKKLAKGKKYYVRLRSYKNVKAGKKTEKLCGAWSKTKNVKVR